MFGPLAEEGDGLVGGLCSENLEAARLQHLASHIEHGAVVVDDQDA
ncbi:MAG: hypothetical protein R2748_31255 [Bryobacterales bacterium]